MHHLRLRIAQVKLTGGTTLSWQSSGSWFGRLILAATEAQANGESKQCYLILLVPVFH